MGDVEGWRDTRSASKHCATVVRVRSGLSPGRGGPGAVWAPRTKVVDTQRLLACASAGSGGCSCIAVHVREAVAPLRPSLVCSHVCMHLLRMQRLASCTVLVLVATGPESVRACSMHFFYPPQTSRPAPHARLDPWVDGFGSSYIRCLRGPTALHIPGRDGWVTLNTRDERAPSGGDHHGAALEVTWQQTCTSCGILTDMEPFPHLGPPSFLISSGASDARLRPKG